MKSSRATTILLTTAGLTLTLMAASGGARLNVAGLLAWIMLGVGALVLGVVFAILLSRRAAAPDAATDPPDGYLARMRLFSRNGQLFILHGVGTNVAFGTWGVLFNLYLLAIGFDVGFVGLYTLLNSTSGALTAIPAGLISDRLGRKPAFLLGHGVVALASLAAVSTANPALLLAAAIVSGSFKPLFGTSTSAFMAENSQDFERTHLFSVSSGANTAAGVVGSSLAGLVPLLVLGPQPVARATVTIYRAVLYAGLTGWFGSLIPLLMLHPIKPPADHLPRPMPRPSRLIFANVRHPDRIWRLTLPSVLIGFGAGFTMPLLNVYFQQALGGSEAAIGATLSAGQVALLVGSFLAPVAAARLGGKVKALIVTRSLSLPFILLLAFAPDMRLSGLEAAFALAALAHVLRMGLMNMGWPLRASFGMEILHPEERGTQAGIQQAIWGLVWGTAGYVGAQLMNTGDYRTPFLLMGGFYAIAFLLFWRFFGGRERDLTLTPQGAPYPQPK